MRFGIVGLGHMGANLARHAMEKGHQVAGYNRDAAATQALAREGLEPTRSIEELAATLTPPRIVFIYVPHGAATESVCEGLRPRLGHGDIVADGGNSHWADSQGRHRACASAWYFYQMPAREKAWCGYCVVGALANVAVFALSMPEARRAAGALRLPRTPSAPERALFTAPAS